MNSKAAYNGILAVNKPAGITSHDLVSQCRKLLDQKSVGHTGTLDPLATGLMLLCLGKATKLSRFISGQDKSYSAKITLGVTSTTFDSEGVDESTRLDIPELDEAKIKDVLNGFTGVIKQQVPAMSAIRVEGKRLYERARKGEAVEAPFRMVEISELKFISYENPVLTVETTVSSGTYIRSLANDFGQAIGCGAFLSSLIRTAIGSVDLTTALNTDEISELIASGQLTERLLPLDQLLEFGAILVTDEFSSLIHQGRALRNEHIDHLEGDFLAGDHVFMKDSRGEVIAVGKACRNSTSFNDGTSGELFKYERVLI